MKLGHFYQSLAKLKPPPCLACLLGKSRRRPWTCQAAPNHLRTFPPGPPGSSISADRLVFSMPMIKPEHVDKLTSTPIVGTKLFADHSSSQTLTHFHLLENFTLDENFKAKVGFEYVADAHGATTRHHHADNGHFDDDGFIKACTSCS